MPMKERPGSQPSGGGTGKERGQARAGHHMKREQWERSGSREPQTAWSSAPAPAGRVG